MKIPIQKHISYLKDTFSEDEFNKISNFIDSKLKNIYTEDKNYKYGIKITDEDIWRLLVTLFLSINDGKKTKSFIYQILTLNGIVDDKLNGKLKCELWNYGCQIKNRICEENNADYNSWDKQDYLNYCCNLSICLRIPDTENGVQYPEFNLNFPDFIKDVDLDDSILKKKVK